MRLKKLVWHIFPANLLITLGSLLALLWYSSTALDEFYSNMIVTDLEDRAYFIEEQVTDLLSDNKLDELNTLFRRIGRKSSTRLTIIDSSGTVIADSDENPSIMSNHSNRPEVKMAFSGEVGTKLRFSSTLGVKMLYVALPISAKISAETNNNHVLRLAMSASFIDRTLHTLRLKVGMSGLIVAVLAMLAAIVVSRKISKPLEQMTEGAEQFAEENFSTSLAIADNCSLEVGALATAMNSMARKLQNRFSTIVHQRNELQTILASMADAVLVIDTKKQLTTINFSASLLFGVPEQSGIGKKTQEIVRNIHIESLIDMTLFEEKVVTKEITLDKDGENLFLQFSGVRLHGDSGESFGAVITFHDVTRIRRLESVRQEFVANVSHELMTPLTSIKGYTETILDGTQNDKELTKKFLKIILRQSDSLQAIVSDLLDLSKIEQEIKHNEIKLVPVKVKNVLDEAIHVCNFKAAEKNMAIALDCPHELTVLLDAQFIEQAAVNLVVNAIKYSEVGSKVEINAELQTAENNEEMLVISVRDYGVGIGREHLPRLFERFYRSDKDRSRKLGGTGLGLAIVKHIVQAHNGRVEVASEVGKGTTFTLLIPATKPAS